MNLKTPMPPLQPFGVFSWEVVTRPAAEVRQGVQAVEGLGFSAIWFPESRGREALTAASLTLEATDRIVVATGIASIWARDAVAAAVGAFGLGEAHRGRFILGLGVSHAPSVERRGETYRRPVARMVDYLDAMASVSSPIAADEPPVPVVLAALGPRMLDTAARRTAGAHPYFVPVGHTEFARAVIGEGPFLAPEQAVVLEADPATARERARRHTEGYLRLDNYRNNLARMGWSEHDLAGGGSDELVDAVVAWGETPAIAGRLRAHLEAGADHVAIQVLHDGEGFPLAELEELAAQLL